MIRLSPSMHHVLIRLAKGERLVISHFPTYEALERRGLAKITWVPDLSPGSPGFNALFAGRFTAEITPAGRERIGV